MEAHDPQHDNEDSLQVLLYGSETMTLTQLNWRRLDSFHTRCQRRILHIRWHDHIFNDEVLRRTRLLAASSIVCKRRLELFRHVATFDDDVSKPYPLDLLQMSRWCAAISRPKTCSRSTSHHLDLTDLPGHGNINYRSTGVGGRQIVLAANRNGGMLRLNAIRVTTMMSMRCSADDASPWWRRLYDVTANCILCELLTDIDRVSVHNSVR